MFKSLLSRVTFKENMFVLSNDKKSYERCVQRHSVVYLVSIAPVRTWGDSLVNNKMTTCLTNLIF